MTNYLNLGFVTEASEGNALNPLSNCVNFAHGWGGEGEEWESERERDFLG